MSSQSVVAVAHRQQPLRQRHSAYQATDHAVWTILCRRRLATLREQACGPFLAGITAVGFDLNRIPNLRHLNRRLVPRTGWAVVPSEGLLSPAQRFRSLSRRRVPSAVTIRSSAGLDEPAPSDIFGDLLGRVPLLADTRYASWLARFGAQALAARGLEAEERFARLFRFTAELGLIREGGDVKLYGSELIGSATQARHALSSECVRRPFDLARVLETPLLTDRLPDMLFVIDRFAELDDALDRIVAVG